MQVIYQGKQRSQSQYDFIMNQHHIAHDNLPPSFMWLRLKMRYPPNVVVSQLCDLLVFILSINSNGLFN